MVGEDEDDEFRHPGSCKVKGGKAMNARKGKATC